MGQNNVARLNELLQKGVITDAIVYTDLPVSGPDHVPLFTSKLGIGDKVVMGTGKSKKLAKDDAASQMLQIFNQCSMSATNAIPVNHSPPQDVRQQQLQQQKKQKTQQQQQHQPPQQQHQQQNMVKIEGIMMIFQSISESSLDIDTLLGKTLELDCDKLFSELKKLLDILGLTCVIQNSESENENDVSTCVIQLMSKEWGYHFLPSFGKSHKGINDARVRAATKVLSHLSLAAHDDFDLSNY